jgi:hypothetical protein
LVLVELVLTLLFTAENATPKDLVTKPNVLEIEEGSVHLKPVDISIDEATLPGSQVMDAIGQLVLALDHDRVTRQPAEGTVFSEGFL